jgi:cytochrome c5
LHADCRQEKKLKGSHILGFAILVLIASYAGAVAPGTDEEISARLQPFGEVQRSAESLAAAQASSETAGGAPKSGKEVYDTFCFACHATGMSDAPKLGDIEAWAPRIAKGMDELLANTINGINVMPPRGTCMGCSDAELEGVLDYILENSQ